MTLEFTKAFRALTGNKPFPWQRKLYNDYFLAGRFPATCNLPTGLGKTSIIAIWLIALANNSAKVPRRLVYVVNRRTVVDQTTDEVQNYRKNSVAAGLTEPLAISTLRGQFADNREWSADPARPAFVCGTVDMIGSRLLFSGYGCGFKSKPLYDLDRVRRVGFARHTSQVAPTCGVYHPRVQRAKANSFCSV